MAMQTTATGKVDRQATCPFHLKLFYRTGVFHSLNDFPTHPSTPLPPHLQIYTWPTLTLRELSHLLVSALPDLLPDPAIGTRLAYRLIYPDPHTSNSYNRNNNDINNNNNNDYNEPQSQGGRFLSKELGSVIVASAENPSARLPDAESAQYVAGGVMAGGLEGEPEKTLQEARFVIGDFVDCCVLAPGRDGSVVGPPPVRGRGAVADGAVRGRENGYMSGYRGRGRGGFGAPEGRLGGGAAGGVPSGEWRRGERLPLDGGVGRGGFRGGRGRGW